MSRADRSLATAAEQALGADSRGAGFFGELSARAAQAQRFGAIAFHDEDGTFCDAGDYSLKLKKNLSTSMSLTQFDNGYWYANELKEFAETIGIPSARKLRKDELEKAIKLFLQTGKIESPIRRNLSTPRVKDVERGLSLDLPVVVYTNNKETKSFLEREALKLAPGLKRRSGVRYRLNRWREEQLIKGVRLTYGSLVRKYVQLNQIKGPFTKIPHGRYINFMSDYLASETGATREQAILAWKELKRLDVPKDYRSWVKSKSSKTK